MLEERISIREYAERLGINHTSVLKAIKAGKISEGYDPKSKEILFEFANKEWGKIHLDGKNENKESHIPNDIPADTEKTDVDPVAPKEKNRYADILTRKLRKQDQLLGLELKQRKGALVDKKELDKQLFEFGKQIRTALETIPDRIIDNLLASKSRYEAHTILLNAIKAALKELTEKREFDFQPN